MSVFVLYLLTKSITYDICMRVALFMLGQNEDWSQMHMPGKLKFYKAVQPKIQAKCLIKV